jgi:hypothetical protein
VGFWDGFCHATDLLVGIFKDVTVLREGCLDGAGVGQDLIEGAAQFAA